MTRRRGGRRTSPIGPWTRGPPGTAPSRPQMMARRRGRCPRPARCRGARPRGSRRRPARYHPPRKASRTRQRPYRAYRLAAYLALCRPRHAGDRQRARSWRFSLRSYPRRSRRRFAGRGLWGGKTRLLTPLKGGLRRKIDPVNQFSEQGPKGRGGSHHPVNHGHFSVR